MYEITPGSELIKKVCKGQMVYIICEVKDNTPG